MDLLSETLRPFRLQTAVFWEWEFLPPWQVTVQNSHLSDFVVCYAVLEGAGYAALSGEEPVPLQAGETVLFPHQDSHVLASATAGVDGATKLACGYLTYEPLVCRTAIARLPRMVKIRVTDEAARLWFDPSIRALAAGDQQTSGWNLVATRLAEVLVIEILREYVNGLEEGGDRRPLAEVRDGAVAKALALMRETPRARWSVAELAKCCGLSRTGFAERFRRATKISPMAYLGELRLKSGAEMLADSTLTVAEIAIEVGYGSEAAFNRAFRRQFGQPPARFRKIRMESVRRGA